MLETSKRSSAAGACPAKPTMASVANNPKPMRRARCIMGVTPRSKLIYRPVAIVGDLKTDRYWLIVDLADGKLTVLLHEAEGASAPNTGNSRENFAPPPGASATETSP